MTPPSHRIGVDLGGTKIEAVVLDEDGGIRIRRRTETPRSFEGSLDAIAALIAAVAEETGAPADVPVGFGIPGTPSPVDGRVRNANSTWLNGHRLEAALTQRLQRPVRLENDANCFALSEAADGAAAGARSVFGVILGTGVGGGLVIDGRLHSGSTRIAGEWGHIALPPADATEVPGPACWCGRNGCVETWLSGPAMVADHCRMNPREEDGVSTAREIEARAAAEDPAAVATLNRYIARLARGLSVIVNVVDPEVIVLGGGVSNLPGLAERVEADLPAHVFSDVFTTRVVPNRHGDSSGVLGAARLWDPVSSP